MKIRNLIVLIISLFISCKKDDAEKSISPSSTVPTSIYGTYNANIVNNTTSSNYVQIWQVIPNDSVSVFLIHNYSGPLSDTIFCEVNDNDLIIPAQTKPNSGWVGGTVTISGSGTYSDPQFVLTIGQSYSASTTIYNYTMTGVRQ